MELARQKAEAEEAAARERVEAAARELELARQKEEAEQNAERDKFIKILLLVLYSTFSCGAKRRWV